MRPDGLLPRRRQRPGFGALCLALAFERCAGAGVLVTSGIPVRGGRPGGGSEARAWLPAGAAGPESFKLSGGGGKLPWTNFPEFPLYPGEEGTCPRSLS